MWGGRCRAGGVRREVLGPAQKASPWRWCLFTWRVLRGRAHGEVALPWMSPGRRGNVRHPRGGHGEGARADMALTWLAPSLADTWRCMKGEEAC
eukprot:355410-Chlamydomonas_euryale.AAC.1